MKTALQNSSSKSSFEKSGDSNNKNCRKTISQASLGNSSKHLQPAQNQETNSIEDEAVCKPKHVSKFFLPPTKVGGPALTKSGDQPGDPSNKQENIKDLNSKVLDAAKIAEKKSKNRSTRKTEDQTSEKKSTMRQREESEHEVRKSQFKELCDKVQAFVLEANFRIPKGMKQNGSNPFFGGYRVSRGEAILQVGPPDGFEHISVETHGHKVRVTACYSGVFHPALAQLPTHFEHSFSLLPGQNIRALRVEENKLAKRLMLKLKLADS